MMVNCMCQLDRTTECPDVWLNIISGCYGLNIVCPHKVPCIESLVPRVLVLDDRIFKRDGLLRSPRSIGGILSKDIQLFLLGPGYFS